LLGATLATVAEVGEIGIFEDPAVCSSSLGFRLNIRLNLDSLCSSSDI
jgi:hypothetical protein